MLQTVIGAMYVLWWSPAPAQPRSPEIHVWIRAFIPNRLANNPGYVHQTRKGTWVIPAPGADVAGLHLGPLAGTCFETDNREFDSKLDASARVAVEFIMHFRGRRDFELVAPPQKHDYATIGETHNADCASGADLHDPKRTSSSTVSVGSIRENNFLRIFNIRASSGNPFYTVFGISIAPKIDFEIVFEYNILTTTITLKGTTGTFPALEGYYSVDGATKTLFTLAPVPGATARSLLDLGTGINMRNFEVKIDLTRYF